MAKQFDVNDLFELCGPWVEARGKGAGKKRGPNFNWWYGSASSCLLFRARRRAIAPTSAATMTAPARGYLLVRVEEASGKTQRGDLFTWDTTSGSFEAFVKGAPHSTSACTLSSPALADLCAIGALRH